MRIQQVAVDEHVKDVASVWIASGVVLMLGVAGRRGQYVLATRMLGRSGNQSLDRSTDKRVSRKR